MSGVLFVGNGINRAFDQSSWKQLINSVHKKYGTENLYQEKSSLPMPMQIIVATGDRVNEAMQEIAGDMNFQISEEQKAFLDEILKLPVSNIITTNYTFELEQAAGIKSSVYSYRKARAFTKECTEKDKQFNLFKYYNLENSDKKIWHIHGDISTPSSIIMGNYYYGKLLREIEDYIPSFMRRYAYSRKNGTELTEYSWVDSFLTKNVYMMGFGLDFNESDIWWLICCKKRHFPDTKVYFYQPAEDITAEQKLMLDAYDVEIIHDLKHQSYTEFYIQSIKDITSKLKGENQNG